MVKISLLGRKRRWFLLSHYLQQHGHSLQPWGVEQRVLALLEETKSSQGWDPRAWDLCAHPAPVPPCQAARWVPGCTPALGLCRAERQAQAAHPDLGT